MLLELRVVISVILFEFNFIKLDVVFFRYSLEEKCVIKDKFLWFGRMFLVCNF